MVPDSRPGSPDSHWIVQQSPVKTVALNQQKRKRAHSIDTRIRSSSKKQVDFDDEGSDTQMRPLQRALAREARRRREQDRQRELDGAMKASSSRLSDKRAKRISSEMVPLLDGMPRRKTWQESLREDEVRRDREVRRARGWKQKSK